MTLLLLLLLPLLVGLLLPLLPPGRPGLVRGLAPAPPWPSWWWACWPGASRPLP